MSYPHYTHQHIAQAAAVLNSGGVVAYPTEAVWGLGCDPFCATAVERILAMKHRGRGMGLILIAASIHQFQPFLEGLLPKYRDQLDASWPGVQTWLVPNNHVAPPWVTGGRDTLALRVTDHPVAAALCHKFGGPLVSTSANPHGLPPAKSVLKVKLYFRDKLDYLVPGLLGKSNKPTPIKHLITGETIRLG
ncbi:MAG: Sua5/YciO/YrdC/YwlC family protein [Porticoccus sp.]